MTKHKEFIKIITEIENEFDVNSLICDGVNVWPLIRLELVDLIMNNQVHKAPIILSIDGLKVKNEKNEKVFNNLLDDIDVYANCDILLYEDEYQNSLINVNDTYYNRFMDSFYELYKNNYDIKIINHRDNTKKIFYEDEKIDISFIKEVIRINSLLLYKSSEYSINDLHIFLEYLKNKKKLILEYEYIKYLVSYLMSSAIYMEKILKKIKSKVLFLICYYTPFNMGLVLATKRIGIKSVELQHGIQNDYHYMYTNWNKLPLSGYELIPKVFWMWGDIAKERILRWVQSNSYHDVYVGGNSFLSNLDNLDLTPELKDIAKYYPVNKTNILITLQLKDHYREYITNVINNCDDSIMWHFKEHPVHNKNMFIKHIQNKIHNLDNVEFDFTNNTSIYSIMNYIDINITHFSSTAYELNALFKVPIIFTQTDLKCIKENGIYYVNNELELANKVEYIKSNVDNIKLSTQDSRYISFNKNNIKNNFNELLDEDKTRFEHIDSKRLNIK